MAAHGDLLAVASAHALQWLQRSLGRISHRTLAKTLKDMEADGLIHRQDFGEIPPRVEYSLTARGRSLEPVLAAMEAWAEADAAAD